MRLLLDTNRYDDLVNREREVTHRVEHATSVWLSVVTLGELRAGFARGTREEENECRLQDVLQLQGVRVLGVNEETSQFYARVRKSLWAAGRPIPTNDIWIAAQALQYNLVLDTRDSDFDHVPGLRLVDQ